PSRSDKDMKTTLQTFAEDLRSELPGQQQLWAKAADLAGLPPGTYPKAILRYLDEQNAWDRLESNAEFMDRYRKEFLAEAKYTVTVDQQRAEDPLRLHGKHIAYFSAEFGSMYLKTYSGGLGILAGDMVRGASDLGLNFTGVGLLYKKGFFKQRLD